jgi:hypothetical protein
LDGVFRRFAFVGNGGFTNSSKGAVKDGGEKGVELGGGLGLQALQRVHLRLQPGSTLFRFSMSPLHLIQQQTMWRAANL